MVNKPRVACFSVPCRYQDGEKQTDDWKETVTKVLAGRRKERPFIRNCTALIRILRCLGTKFLWEWPWYTAGWNDPSMKIMDMYESTGARAECEKTRMEVLWGTRESSVEFQPGWNVVPWSLLHMKKSNRIHDPWRGVWPGSQGL